MVPQTKLDPTTNPIELLDNTLEQSWRVLCETYEVETELSNVQNLFAKATIKTPPKAAETVLVNMITEVIENVGRFGTFIQRFQKHAAQGCFSRTDFTGNLDEPFSKARCIV